MILSKKVFRCEVKSQIKSLSLDYINSSNLGIFNGITLLPEFISAKRIFTYISVDREPDTRKLIEKSFELEKVIAVPCDVLNGNMNFAILNSDVSELRLDIYGIPCPDNNAKRIAPEKGDLIIVPALCCSLDGQRLGYGGGYYDRFLADTDALKVCLCREKLLTASLPWENHDIPVDIIVTEENITRPRRAPC